MVSPPLPLERGRPLALVASLVVIVGALACGDSGSPTSPGGGGIPPVVTRLDDDTTPGTLRWAINHSSGSGAVTFADNLCTGATPEQCKITLILGQLSILNGGLTISGPTTYQLAIDGGGTAPVLYVWSQPPWSARNLVSVSNLTISGGFGGGIFNQGILSLTNVTVTANTRASLPIFPGGGGILNLGSLTLTTSTVSGNTVTNGPGGGILNGIFDTLRLVNSTVSGNTVTNGSGGGIFNDGTLILTNSRVSGNTATDGGGIWTSLSGLWGASSGTATLTNSTVSGNTAQHSGGGIVNDNSTLKLQEQTCVNNNTVGSTSSSTPWDAINIAQVGGSVTGLNCGIPKP